MSLTFIAAGVACPSWVKGVGANARMGDRPDSVTTAKKAARFPRAMRLLRHADFERVYKQGRRQFSALMTVFYLVRPEAQSSTARAKMSAPHETSALQGPRIGFAVGRVLGGAVQRNRMKRRLREAVRLSLPAVLLRADVVIHPRKPLLSAGFDEIVNEVRLAFARIERGLSNDSQGNAGTRAAGEKD